MRTELLHAAANAAVLENPMLSGGIVPSRCVEAHRLSDRSQRLQNMDWLRGHNRDSAVGLTAAHQNPELRMPRLGCESG